YLSPYTTLFRSTIPICIPTQRCRQVKILEDRASKVQRERTHYASRNQPLTNLPITSKAVFVGVPHWGGAIYISSGNPQRSEVPGFFYACINRRSPSSLPHLAHPLTEFHDRYRAVKPC